ncbi:hypothetical protein HDU84_009088 [Entophlyctis sp. JEL0112]|nr:hypothetical protein HDU84_009088 [Entophlyctis sp. JEL0112]
MPRTVTMATFVSSISKVTTQSPASVVNAATTTSLTTSEIAAGAFTTSNIQSIKTNLEVTNGSSDALSGTNMSGTIATAVAAFLVIVGAIIWRRRLWAFWSSRQFPRFWKRKDDPNAFFADALETLEPKSVNFADSLFKIPEKSKRFIPTWRSTAAVMPPMKESGGNGHGFFAPAEYHPVAVDALNVKPVHSTQSVSTGSVVVMGSTVERLYEDVAASQLRNMQQSQKEKQLASELGVPLSSAQPPPPSYTESASAESMPPSSLDAVRSTTVSSTGSSDETFLILRGPAYKNPPTKLPERSSNPGRSEISFEIVPNVEGRKLGAGRAMQAEPVQSELASEVASSSGFTDASFQISPTYVAPAFASRMPSSNDAAGESSTGLSDLSFQISQNPALSQAASNALSAEAGQPCDSISAVESSFDKAPDSVDSGGRLNGIW